MFCVSNVKCCSLRLLASQHFGLAVLEGTPGLDIGAVVFLDRGVAERVALGLAGLSEQDQRCGVRRRGRECDVEDEWVGARRKLTAALTVIQMTTPASHHADGFVHLVGQPRDLLGQLSVLRKHLEVLLDHRSFTAQHLGLARLELVVALILGVFPGR